ncbi:MAG: hypothetical protein HYX97_06160 [Chloroflexi bacterium]|nr:hypothetical protein [Chloroflexota bacterium]
MARLTGGSAREIYQKLPAGMYEPFRRFYRALWENGAVEAPLKEMVRLRSAQLNDCTH